MTAGVWLLLAVPIALMLILGIATRFRLGGLIPPLAPTAQGPPAIRHATGPYHAWWCSFWTDADDYRPLRDPPEPGILGWWVSGQHDTASGVRGSLVMMVIAESAADARATISRDWPEAESPCCEWRFCDQCSLTPPGDRFPLSPWMRSRFDAAHFAIIDHHPDPPNTEKA